MEPSSGFSTYCRKCGDYFRIEPQAAQAGHGLFSLFKGHAKPPAAAPPRPPSMPLQIVGFSEEAEIMAQSSPAAAKSGPEKQAQRTVTCFDCQHVHRVSRMSSSSLCPNCGCYIDLRDVVIKDRTAQRIKTRGDVIVEKKGALLGTSITCGNLTVHGSVAGSIHASGQVLFHASGKILGEVRCQHLIVEKKSEVQFLQPVTAEVAEIYGETTGNFHLAGRLHIGKRGGIAGSVEAKRMSMETGAKLLGSVRVLPRPIPPWRHREPAESPSPPDDSALLAGIPLLPP